MGTETKEYAMLLPRPRTRRVPRTHRPRRELLRLAVLAVIAGNVLGRHAPR